MSCFSLLCRPSQPQLPLCLGRGGTCPWPRTRCWRPRRCSGLPTRSPGQRRPSFLASWLGPGELFSILNTCKSTYFLPFRDNPCPHLGNIVTIKLSENQENVPQTDNTYLTMIVETHFQVNYTSCYAQLVSILMAKHYIILIDCWYYRWITTLGNGNG